MDILQVLKAEFKERTSDLVSSQCVDSAWVSRFECHLAMEAEFLLPEVQAICDTEYSVCQRLERELLGLLDMFREFCESSQSEQQLALFTEKFLEHTAFVEEKVFPLMRQKISTPEREALVAVIDDLKTEFLVRAANLAM